MIASSEISWSNAFDGTDRKEWLGAVYEEMKSLIENDTWELTDKPPNKKVVGCRTVLRNKCDADGSHIRRKARVVAQGFSQRPGVDFMETFAPVARIESLRMLLAVSAKHDLLVT